MLLQNISQGENQAALPHGQVENKFLIHLIKGKRSNSKHYDSFVLLSGDGDFESLLKYLKAYRKRCVALSTKGHISIELIRQAKFVDFKKLKGDISF